MPSIKDYEVPSDVAVDGANITAVVGGEESDDVEIVGHLISYTIGSDFTVPRTADAQGFNDEWADTDWGLKERMEELGLFIEHAGERRTMVPPKVTAKRAFNRTRDRIVRELTLEHDTFHKEGAAFMTVQVGSDTVEKEMHFESKKATTDEWHVTAEAFFTADEIGEDDGEWRQTTVCIFRYDQENRGIQPYPKVEKDDGLWPACELFAEYALQMFETMQQGHIGRDIQKMLNRFTGHWTKTIKVRDGGAVYFVPAGYDEQVRALKTLIDEIDRKFKTRGRDCELLRVSVTNSEEERKQIEERAQKHIRQQVETALDAAFETLMEDEDAVAEEIADDLEDRLDALDDFTGGYNALLSARLSAQDVVEDRLKSLEGEKEAIVAQALEQAGSGDGEVASASQ